MAQNWKKLFSRVNWQNKPSTATALGATNLNKSDYALDQIDDRVIQLDTLKADMQTVNGMVADVSVNTTNGIITVTKKDGSKQTFDTKLEKLAVNFEYDATNQRLVITLDDGTKQYVDMSALINEYDFKDTSTVAFSVSGGKVEASVKDGSITEAKLQPNYLANIKTEVAKAENSVSAAANSATAASASATAAADNATLSKSYAIGNTGTRTGEDTDNAKYYYEKTRDKSFDLDTTTVSDFGNPVSLPTAKGKIIDFKANGYVKKVGEPYSGGWTNGMWQNDGGFSPGGDVYSSDNTAWDNRIRCKPGDVIELLGSDNYNIAHATIVFGDENGYYVDGVLIENGKAYWNSKGNVPQDISSFKVVVPSGSAENLDFSVLTDRAAEVNNYKEVSLLINNSPSHLEALGDLGLVDLGDLSWMYNSTYKYMYAYYNNGNLPTQTTEGVIGYCTKYNVNTDNISLNALPGKNMKISWKPWTSTQYAIVINDTSYTDATAFKNAMKGVMLAYETEKGFASKYGLPIISESPNLLDIPNQTITSTNFIDAKPIDLSIGIYTFSYNAELVSGGFSWALKDKDKVNIVSGNTLKEVHQVINLTREAKYITIYTSGSCNISNVQLEKSNTPTEYQPYAKSTSIIPLTEPLFNGDVIYKYADGTGKIVKKMGQVDLGTLNWSVSNGVMYTINLRGISKGTDNNNVANIYCSKYQANTGGNVTNKRVDKSIADVTNTALYVYDTSYTDATAFKTAMSGVKLVYELATPTEIPLTAEQLQAFEKVDTFKGITILSMPFDSTMDVSAFKDNKDGESVSGIESKIEGINEKLYKKVALTSTSHNVTGDYVIIGNVVTVTGSFVCKNATSEEVIINAPGIQQNFGITFRSNNNGSLHKAWSNGTKINTWQHDGEMVVGHAYVFSFSYVI